MMNITNNPAALRDYKSPETEFLTFAQLSPVLTGSIGLGSLEEETSQWDFNF